MWNSIEIEGERISINFTMNTYLLNSNGELFFHENKNVSLKKAIFCTHSLVSFIYLFIYFSSSNNKMTMTMIYLSSPS